LPQRPPSPKANGQPTIPETLHIPSIDDYEKDPDYFIESWMNLESVFAYAGQACTTMPDNGMFREFKGKINK